MDRKVLKCTHRVGRHCGSTSIRDICEYFGISDIEEPLCFGLGEGLGFWYLKDIPLSPSILIHVRTYPLEKNFFTNLGVPFKWEQFSERAKALEALIKKIYNNQPALIQTDIYYLPYFNSSTHFPGHAIVVWGVSEKKREFYVSDTKHPDLLSVPFDYMEQALYSTEGFFKSLGNQFTPPFLLSLPPDMEKVLKRAIFNTSYNMLNPSSPQEGIKAMRRWIEEIDTWAQLEDWRWTARFTYQVIEKRGTGGGGFRLLYGDFLKEAAQYIPLLRERHLIDKMYRLGEKWREVAYGFKEISEGDPTFTNMRPLLEELYHMEYSFHLTMVKLLSSS